MTFFFQQFVDVHLAIFRTGSPKRHIEKFKVEINVSLLHSLILAFQLIHILSKGYLKM